MILIIDNYDSFTFNLYQAVVQHHDDVKVVRNDNITLEEIAELAPTAIILSPGPGLPVQAGICLEVVKQFACNTPMLGVCLGQQTIAQAFGLQVVPADEIVHGKASIVFHDRQAIFADMPLPFYAGRYHSLIVKQCEDASPLNVIARGANGEIMAITHQQYPCFGVQFHPESILTECGDKLIQSFVSYAVQYHQTKEALA